MALKVTKHNIFHHRLELDRSNDQPAGEKRGVRLANIFHRAFGKSTTVVIDGKRYHLNTNSLNKFHVKVKSLTTNDVHSCERKVTRLFKNAYSDPKIRNEYLSARVYKDLVEESFGVPDLGVKEALLEMVIDAAQKGKSVPIKSQFNDPSLSLVKESAQQYNLSIDHLLSAKVVLDAATESRVKHEVDVLVEVLENTSGLLIEELTKFFESTLGKKGEILSQLNQQFIEFKRLASDKELLKNELARKTKCSKEEAEKVAERQQRLIDFTRNNLCMLEAYLKESVGQDETNRLFAYFKHAPMIINDLCMIGKEMCKVLSELSSSNGFKEMIQSNALNRLQSVGQNLSPETAESMEHIQYIVEDLQKLSTFTSQHADQVDMFAKATLDEAAGIAGDLHRLFKNRPATKSGGAPLMTKWAVRLLHLNRSRVYAGFQNAMNDLFVEQRRSPTLIGRVKQSIGNIVAGVLIRNKEIAIDELQKILLKGSRSIANLKTAKKEHAVAEKEYERAKNQALEAQNDLKWIVHRELSNLHTSLNTPSNFNRSASRSSLFSDLDVGFNGVSDIEDDSTYETGSETSSIFDAEEFKPKRMTSGILAKGVVTSPKVHELVIRQFSRPTQPVLADLELD